MIQPGKTNSYPCGIILHLWQNIGGCEHFQFHENKMKMSNTLSYLEM